MRLYKKVPEDRCTKQVGLQCGYPKAEHPLNVSGNFHEFQGGATKFVPATREDIEEVLENMS